jgi:hypothetical protein
MNVESMILAMVLIVAAFGATAVSVFLITSAEQ